MPKRDTYPTDPRILEAARQLADEVVAPAVVSMSDTIAGELGERSLVVATALTETLYRVVLREDTARWFAVAAEQEHGYGIVETRTAIGRLAGFSRAGIERRLALVGGAKVGRHGWTPREISDAVIVDRAIRAEDR